MLCSLHRKSDAAVPLAGAGSMFLPCSKVTAENVEAYQKKLQARLKEGDAAPVDREAA